VGERTVRIRKVKGSNPSVSTKAKIPPTFVGGIFALYYSFLSFQSSFFSFYQRSFHVKRSSRRILCSSQIPAALFFAEKHTVGIENKILSVQPVDSLSLPFSV